METLIVLGLFSVVLTTAADIFLMSNRAQRKTVSMERVQSDARYTMEAMVREIRSGAVDYAWYGENLPLDGANAVDTLALIDGQGDRIRFFRNREDSECGSGSEAVRSCLLVSINGGATQVLTPTGINVFRASFFIRPVADPYGFDAVTGLYGASSQPAVTIVLGTENISADPRERSLVYLQTTVGTRNFRR